MPLRFCVTSANKHLFGDKPLKEFVASGGTIGRKADNDWVLPDPNRYISGRHAMIDFQGGAYYIVDTSRNGVYINGADVPVGRGHPQRLFDGDRLRVGDYDIKIVITEEEDGAEDDGMRDSVVRAQLVDEDESVEMALVDENSLTEDSALARHLSAAGGDPAEPQSRLSQPAEAHRFLEETGVGRAEDHAVAVLLKAAGLKPTDVNGGSSEDILQTAGLLLRGLVGGLMDLMHERSQLKEDFRLSQTMIQGADNNPLKFSPTVVDALQYLLSDRSDSYLAAREAIFASYQEIKNHEKAVPRAMVQALRDYMEHLDPDELKSRFDQGLKRNPLLAGTNRLKYWELYEESYRTLTHGEDGRLPEIFSAEFGRAYEREIENLKTVPRKKTA